jgi:RNA recognition motif-containing protein
VRMASVGTPTSDTSFALSHRADQDGHEEVRTLFVSGLPEDVRERELYNLMRTFEGYEGSQIKKAAKSSKVSRYLPVCIMYCVSVQEDWLL